MFKFHNKPHVCILYRKSKTLHIRCYFIHIIIIGTDTLQPAVFAPYDLILEQWGSVDVKSSPIKKDKYGNTYAAFNTQNFTKGVKYAFCVALTEDRQDFVAVFAIPGKLVYGHSTIHITLSPLSKKYSKFLIWKSEIYAL